MPKYAKFMKDLLTQRGRGNKASKITLNERCSAMVLNEIPLKEKDPEILFGIYGAFFILDKLTKVVKSSRLPDKMKVVFVRAHSEDESFAGLMRDLCFSLRISLSKKCRLLAELEVLAERGDKGKSLEHMRETVARDVVTLGDLEKTIGLCSGHWVFEFVFLFHLKWPGMLGVYAGTKGGYDSRWVRLFAQLQVVLGRQCRRPQNATFIVTLFGAIPVIIPVIPEVPIVPADPIATPEVGTVSVVSPAGVHDLVDYSYSFDFDPSKDSLPPAPDLSLVSPFLCSDDLETDGESEPVEQRPVSSSHDTLAPLSDFPLALVVSPPGIRRRPAILRVRPIPARRLAWRRISHHSSDHHSSPDSSSSSSPSDHSLSGHAPLDTTDADSSTPHRFVHRSLARTPRRSEAFRHWRSAPLSTLYPSTTSESSLGSSSKRSLDSSSYSSGPSRKRCRSLTASVPSPTHVSRSIAPTLVDLLPPRKRFRDSYSPEDSEEKHMEVDIVDAEAVADVGISERVVAYPEDGVGMGFEIAASDVREDDEEFEADASAADMKEIHVDPLAIDDKVRIDRITEIETTQRQLETSQLVASRKRASLEEFRQVRRDRDDTQRRLRRLESYVERHLGFRP
ncbi:hypothetical protein Tco_0340804 [Tanacetum coccineum]